MKSMIAILLTSLCVPAVCLAASTPKDEPRFNKGRDAFKVNCATCHGENGDGQGPAGKFLKPAPRNFAKDALKQGCTEADVLKTLNEGVKNTAMPPFQQLPEVQRKEIAHYVFHNWINNKNPRCKKAWTR